MGAFKITEAQSRKVLNHLHGVLIITDGRGGSLKRLQRKRTNSRCYAVGITFGPPLRSDELTGRVMDDCGK